MNWLVNLILWACVLPVLPVQFFVMRNEAKFKKNIVVGVTMPYEARENTDVKRRLERYNRELVWAFLVVLLAAIPGFFIPSFNVAMLVWGIWLIAMLVLPNIPFVRCNRDLKEIKRANGWSRRSSDIVHVDTATIGTGKWLSPWLFAPAVLLCLLPVFWDRELAVLYLVDAVCALGCWGGYRYLYRNRAETVDENRELSQLLSHIRRRNWGKLWLFCAYFFAVLNGVMWLLIDQPVWSLALILALSLFLVCASVYIEFLTRRMQEKLTVESGKAWYVDEDDKWIWGLIYYNPNDSRTIINNRIGMNSTVNLARPAGKIIALLSALLLLAVPFSGFMIDGIGSKPMEIRIVDEVVIASHGSSCYEVAVEDIETAELLETLPDGLRRVYGTGTGNLLKGKFRANEIGSLTVCLDPQSAPFLLIKTNDGQYFLFGTRDRAATELAFAHIRE